MTLKEPHRALANFLHIEVLLWAWHKHLNVNSEVNIFLNVKGTSRILNDMSFQP